jgi:hypothetical protein
LLFAGLSRLLAAHAGVAPPAQPQGWINREGPTWSAAVRSGIAIIRSDQHGTWSRAGLQPRRAILGRNAARATLPGGGTLVGSRFKLLVSKWLNRPVRCCVESPSYLESIQLEGHAGCIEGSDRDSRNGVRVVTVR